MQSLPLGPPEQYCAQVLDAEVLDAEVHGGQSSLKAREPQECAQTA